MDKTCPTCEETLHSSNFYKQKRSKDGLHTYCKPCHLVRGNKWRTDNPDSAAKIRASYHSKNRDALALRRHESNLKKLYGMSVGDYCTMENGQAGLCAICGKENSRGRKLCVDHCHENGGIRGLLCDRCNLGLGCLGDSVEALNVAVSYLSKFEALGGQE